MALPTKTTVFLGEFETNTLLAREVRGPGTYRVKLMIMCNSLLSSIFIEDADAGATVEAKYWDTTTGDETTPERYDLLGHDVYGAANIGETHRILVTKIHNKPQLELIVTGGNVKVGVYGTAVSSSASDLDSSLIRDGDTFAALVSKALPVACLDRDTNTLNFIPCKDGKLWITGDVSISRVTTPVIGNLPLPLAGQEYSYTFPANTRRYIIQNTENGSVDVGLASGFSTLAWTMYPGDRLSEKDFELAGYTLYFKPSKAAQVLQIWSWS